MKVLTPVTPSYAGAATRAKPPIITPLQRVQSSRRAPRTVFGGASARLLKQSSTFRRAGYEPENGSQITTAISRILPGVLQDGDVGVGVFPEREKILICSEGFVPFPGKPIRTA